MFARPVGRSAPRHSQWPSSVTTPRARISERVFIRTDRPKPTEPNGSTPPMPIRLRESDRATGRLPAVRSCSGFSRRYSFRFGDFARHLERYRREPFRPLSVLFEYAEGPCSSGAFKTDPSAAAVEHPQLTW